MGFGPWLAVLWKKACPHTITPTNSNTKNKNTEIIPGCLTYLPIISTVANPQFLLVDLKVSFFEECRPSPCVQTCKSECLSAEAWVLRPQTALSASWSPSCSAPRHISNPEGPDSGTESPQRYRNPENGQPLKSHSHNLQRRSVAACQALSEREDRASEDCCLPHFYPGPRRPMAKTGQCRSVLDSSGCPQKTPRAGGLHRGIHVLPAVGAGRLRTRCHQDWCLGRPLSPCLADPHRLTLYPPDLSSVCVDRRKRQIKTERQRPLVSLPFLRRTPVLSVECPTLRPHGTLRSYLQSQSHCGEGGGLHSMNFGNRRHNSLHTRS